MTLTFCLLLWSVSVAQTSSFDEKQIQTKERHQQQDKKADQKLRFFEAVYADDFQEIKKLLDQGVDVNITSNLHDTALHLTINKKILQLLLQHGADVHMKDSLGMTPLFNKETELAKLLLKAGADVNARSRKENTPFIWQTYSGYLEGLMFLKANGANINACNKDKQNAFDIAEHFQPNTATYYYLEALKIPPCQ